eukprot:213141-Prymnesium_polylepis.2
MDRSCSHPGVFCATERVVQPPELLIGPTHVKLQRSPLLLRGPLVGDDQQRSPERTCALHHCTLVCDAAIDKQGLRGIVQHVGSVDATMEVSVHEHAGRLKVRTVTVGVPKALDSINPFLTASLVASEDEFRVPRHCPPWVICEELALKQYSPENGGFRVRGESRKLSEVNRADGPLTRLRPRRAHDLVQRGGPRLDVSKVDCERNIGWPAQSRQSKRPGIAVHANAKKCCAMSTPHTCELFATRPKIARMTSYSRRRESWRHCEWGLAVRFRVCRPARRDHACIMALGRELVLQQWNRT